MPDWEDKNGIKKRTTKRASEHLTKTFIKAGFDFMERTNNGPMILLGDVVCLAGEKSDGRETHKRQKSWPPNPAFRDYLWTFTVTCTRTKRF
ncbi:hypothetical protein CEXT_45261 [Caerostris extrusa]|uniref:Uncharacterized protein n=1 Tax=Caerostris extrusa TaxID=172846 RepID=A0AAV4T9T7_CAEEX|nr:hypothetical protein CEXT_45261 [Caerostris extrusa]